MITNAQKQAVEQAWTDRARTQDYKPGTKKYATMQVEFFIGVMHTLQTLHPDKDNPTRMSSKVPPIWLINIMSGRDVVTGK